MSAFERTLKQHLVSRIVSLERRVCLYLDGGVEVLLVVVQLSSPASPHADSHPTTTTTDTTTDAADWSDVQVVNYDSKLRVVARHVTSSTQPRVTSRSREISFSRELDVARPVRRDTLRAALQRETARLWVAAAVTSSTWRPGMRSEAELCAAVSGVLPADAQPIGVELR